MTGRILHTIFTRGISLAGSFLMVWLTARFLGAEARGIISLLTFGLAITGAVSGIAAGPVLVYLASRGSARKLIITASWWSVISSLIVPPLLVLAEVISPSLFWHTVLLSFLSGIFTTYASLLLGSGNIQKHNTINLLPPVVSSLALGAILLSAGDAGLPGYLLALYASYLLPFAIALAGVPVFMKDKKPLEDGMRLTLTQFSQGLKIQAATFFQLVSYRAAFVVSAHYLGEGDVGVLSVAVALAEAVWVLSKSLATFQYSAIAGSRDEGFNRSTTKKLVLVSLGGTFVLLLALLALPPEFYTSVFGNEYGQTRSLLLPLAPGVLFIAVSTIYTHYFSGKGLNLKNTWTSLASAAVSILASFWLVPEFGLTGAALATSAAYLVNLIMMILFYYGGSRT